MVIAITEPDWMHTAGQAAGTVLLLELFVALFVILVLMAVLAFSVWWAKSKVVPVLREYAPRAAQVMTTTQHGTDRVVQGVAEFFGRRQQVETSIRVLLFGRGAAQRVRENALVQASTDLELMAPAEEGPGPENGWTPQPRRRGREVYSDADQPSTPPMLERPGSPNGGPITWRPRQADGNQRATNEEGDGYDHAAGATG